MKLLIVDDLISVVNGLLHGIQWSELGITKIYAAYNAYEAKQILLTEGIDILLCDIEMPQESGIDLLKWTRENNIDIICIFLTSHAQFDYAKEAITLRGFDYILQPAPYDEIKNAVCRAIDQVNNNRGLEQKSAYGEIFLKQNEMIREKIFTDVFEGRMTQENYRTMCKAVHLPDWDKKCYQVLIQMIHMSMDINSFGEDLLRFVIKNIAGELFAPYDQDIILIEHDKMIYNMIIYSTKESSMEYINVIHQLEIFKAELETYLKGKIACYIGEGINLSNINDQNRKLSILMDKNLAMKNKVYQISEMDREKREEEGLQYIPQYERWIRYIKQNLYETARNEICDYLNYLSEHNEISHETLALFQMNLIRLMNVIAEEKNIQPQIIYKKYLLDEVYVNSTKSLENMQIFADAIIDTAEELYKDEIEILDKVNLVRRYINDNIEKDIKRIDIANHLHLNIDYLNRVFKKETGLALNEYIVVEKMNIARHLIRTTMLPISFIAARIGISNFSHFSKIYKRTFQISPSEERRSKS